jgi:glycosyltransferase involved in cell wall biosynthesis
MKILIVSDAAPPQINGVVRTLQNTIRELEDLGHDVLFITPNDFKTITLPFYKEISIAYSFEGLEARIEQYDPDCIHVSTEGPLGWKVRNLCIKHDWMFTTAYHTDFPGYLRKHFHVPLRLSYWVMRKFHSASARIMVATNSVMDELEEYGIRHTSLWSRGVNSNIFNPDPERKVNAIPKIFYIGRVSREKNIEAFLDIVLPYEFHVVGDGPHLNHLQDHYPDVTFHGGVGDPEELARYYNQADVMVFPSRTDTFGLVIIESIACGTPVAAYPVKGPRDILSGETGAMNEDLKISIERALLLNREKVSQYALWYTWGNATKQFLKNLIQKERI